MATDADKKEEAATNGGAERTAGSNPAATVGTPTADRKPAAGGTGDGNGNSGNGGTVAGAAAKPVQPTGQPRSNSQPVAAGNRNPGSGGVQTPARGSDNRGSGSGQGAGQQRHSSAQASQERPKQSVLRLDDEEEAPPKPLPVPIPKKQPKQTAAATTKKAKKDDAEEASVAELVSAGFEGFAWYSQRLIPLQGGHPWWHKSPAECKGIAKPLTDIINDLSPDAKKLITGNMNVLLLVGGIAAAMHEPIEMELELRRQIRQEAEERRAASPRDRLRQTRNPNRSVRPETSQGVAATDSRSGSNGYTQSDEEDTSDCTV
jgi:hypothetical protein